MPKGFLEWATAIDCCNLCYSFITRIGGLTASPAYAAQVCYDLCSCCSSSFNVDPIEYLIEFIDCIIEAFFKKE